MTTLVALDPNDYDGTDLSRAHKGSVVVDMVNSLITEANNSAKAGTTPTFADVTLTADAAVAAGSGVTGAETPALRKLVLTLVDTPVVLADNAGVTAYGGLKVADLPEGAILFMGATADLATTLSSAGVNAAWDGDFGLGTVTAASTTPLATTEQDLIPTTATPQAVAGVGTATGQSTATESGVIFDGTGTAKDVFLNFVVDDADHDVTTTACNIIVNGTITLVYALLGDY